MRRSVREVFRGWGDPHFEAGSPHRFYEQSERISICGIPSGALMWGGKTQRGRATVELTGKGCELVKDWDRAEDALLALPAMVFKRGDIKADFFRGEVTHERVVQAHTAGRFKRGGRPPSLETIVSTDENKGRTCYVGARGGDAMVRCYEKGKKEFLGEKQISALTDGDPRGVMTTNSALNGGLQFDLADWYRVELELRPDKRALPVDLIARRDEYFAGAYPFLADLLPEVEGQILVTPKQLGILSVERMLEVIKTQYGSALYTALVVHFGSITDVWDKIVGYKHSPSLVEAGALLALLDDEPGGQVVQ